MSNRTLTHVVLFIVAISAIGCGHEGRYVWVKTERYSPDQAELNLMTDKSARYVVAKRERREGAKLVAFDQTSGHLDSGKPFGFRRDERGHTIAYTYRDEHDLGVMDDNVKYLCWIRREYKDPEAPVITFCESRADDHDDEKVDYRRALRNGYRTDIEAQTEKDVRKFRGNTNPYAQ